MAVLDEVHSDEALAFLRARSVAVVGNSDSVLRHRHGEAIDAHDVVIRMNYGIPGWLKGGDQETIGVRTDVVAAAMIAPAEQVLAASCPAYLWWMKRTRLGREHLQEVRGNAFLKQRGVRQIGKAHV